ncbi:L-rhamnose mutarotase [Microbacterium ginsengiterrae]|uniref:L-rhamnose mutarotase n=1 Tax=Microbacterium ginsengiterrae TaxID=546115 RepID=A0A7W9CCY1_9MICO|nr:MULTISPECIES: L-rhamnose mutarotase [Microbacterium]MBB5743181.1 L-rhamnose mutarotase [Microbacterium ginsengiterrae]
MPRVAFTLHVRPEMMDAYIERHSPVWPDMLAEIAAAGRRNYSIFLDRASSTLFGYYETDDDDAARAYLAGSPVAARWEASMAEFFVDLDGRADQAATSLSEVFNLDDQLAASAGSEHESPAS